MQNQTLSNIVSVGLLIALLIFMLLDSCNDIDNFIQEQEIRNNIILKNLQEAESNLLDSVKVYSEKDGVINNNYKTYIQQYEKEIKEFDTTNFTNPQLDSLFTNWKPE